MYKFITLPFKGLGVKTIGNSNGFFSKCTNLTSIYLTYGTWNLKFPEEALNANVEYYTNTVNNRKGIKRLNSIEIGYSVPWCTYTEISKENQTVLPETESVNDVTLICINAKKVLQWVNETQINNSLTIQKVNYIKFQH